MSLEEKQKNIKNPRRKTITINLQETVTVDCLDLLQVFTAVEFVLMKIDKEMKTFEYCTVPCFKHVCPKVFYVEVFRKKSFKNSKRSVGSP